MKIDIKTAVDFYVCETCGMDYATGGKVYVDGKLILEKVASAHCYDGRSYSEEELLILALEKMGHTLTVDGEPFHIMMTDAREDL
jgi:hypothetical protein